MKLEKHCIFCISTIKSLKKFTKFHQVIITMDENMIVIKDSKTFCFNFDWPKVVDENLKPEIEFIKK